MKDNQIPDDDPETLQDDEGGDYTRDAFEKASRGEVVWCQAGDRDDENAKTALAVMISPQRYNELLEIEWQYQELCK